MLTSRISLTHSSGISQVAGGAVSRVKPSSAGLNPAWREAITHVLTVGSWPDGASSDEINQVRDNLKTALQVLQSLAGPANAAYFNEVSTSWLYSYIDDVYHYRHRCMRPILDKLSLAHITANWKRLKVPMTRTIFSLLPRVLGLKTGIGISNAFSSTEM